MKNKTEYISWGYSNCEGLFHRTVYKDGCGLKELQTDVLQICENLNFDSDKRSLYRPFDLMLIVWGYLKSMGWADLKTKNFIVDDDLRFTKSCMKEEPGEFKKLKAMFGETIINDLIR